VVVVTQTLGPAVVVDLVTPDRHTARDGVQILAEYSMHWVKYHRVRGLESAPQLRGTALWRSAGNWPPPPPTSWLTWISMGRFWLIWNLVRTQRMLQRGLQNPLGGLLPEFLRRILPKDVRIHLEHIFGIINQLQPLLQQPLLLSQSLVSVCVSTSISVAVAYRRGLRVGRMWAHRRFWPRFITPTEKREKRVIEELSLAKFQGRWG